MFNRVIIIINKVAHVEFSSGVAQDQQWECGRVGWWERWKTPKRTRVENLGWTKKQYGEGLEKECGRKRWWWWGEGEGRREIHRIWEEAVRKRARGSKEICILAGNDETWLMSEVWVGERERYWTLWSSGKRVRNCQQPSNESNVTMKLEVLSGETK